jgi:hypothetical protein
MSVAKKTTLEGNKPKPSLQHQRDKDRTKVKGMFKFYEVPGGMLSFVFRKYKGDPIERFDLRDGEIVTVPLGVAKHLNTSGWYPIHAHLLDEGGRPVMRVGQKVHRYGFQSLEFMDIDEVPTQESEIVVVTPMG